MTENNTEVSSNSSPLTDEEKRAKQLKKDRILLVAYVITVLIVAYFLDSKITAIKGQQYYDDKGTINTTKP